LAALGNMTVTHNENAEGLVETQKMYKVNLKPNPNLTVV